MVVVTSGQRGQNRGKGLRGKKKKKMKSEVNISINNGVKKHKIHFKKGSEKE